jgi:hypothetical protein
MSMMFEYLAEKTHKNLEEQHRHLTLSGEIRLYAAEALSKRKRRNRRKQTR